MNIKIEQIQLMGTRVLILPKPVSETHEIISAGGLVTASGKEIKNENGIQSMHDVEPPVGTVVAVGDECLKLKVGDIVLFSPFSGKKLTFMLEDYLLMSEVEPVMKINNLESSK